MTASEHQWIDVAPNVRFAVWEAYDATVKANLGATAVVSHGTLVFVDPVPLAPEALEEIRSQGTPAAVILTNGNHERSAADFAARFQIPVYAPHEALPELTLQNVQAYNAGAELPGHLRAVPLTGGGAGETALYHVETGSLIIGDAVLNAPEWGFCVLPKKYCTDARELVKSLRRELPRLTLQRLFFAHGLPIVQNVPEKVAALLASLE